MGDRDDDDLVRRALVLHRESRYDDAERLYRQRLRVIADDADALHYLGVLLCQTGRAAQAAEVLARAVAVRPGDAVVRTNFGKALEDAGQLDRAADEYAGALALAPGLAAAHFNLGAVLHRLGRWRDAADAYARVVRLTPDLPAVHHNLAIVRQKLGDRERAAESFARAVALRPDDPAWRMDLGNALLALHRDEESIEQFARAIALDPAAVAWNNLGVALHRTWRLDEAVAAFQRAAKSTPRDADPHANLGYALASQGRVAEARGALSRAAELAPANGTYVEDLLPLSLFESSTSPRQLLDASAEWARRFATPQAAAAPAAVHSDVGSRRIRIGYVSPDFRQHAAMSFFRPLLEAHDRGAFELTAYANVDRADDLTAALAARFDRWRDVNDRSDAELAQAIRADRIDVLVDLAGHTRGNRLGVFAYRPAVVQISYLGYPATTGLPAMGYRLTDALCDPPGVTDTHYSEQLIRVPAPFLCYGPPQNSPAVVDPPAMRNGYVTFGSFNRPEKVGAESVDLWSRVLIAAGAQSRLVLKSPGMRQRGAGGRIVEAFADRGIVPDRIELLDADVDPMAHLAAYARVDVALDTFPYHGTTTTCEALWMGVPVVTLVGTAHVSRVGLTLLSAIGRAEWVATTPEQYIAVACDLAADARRLSRTRHALRPLVGESPLCDAKRLTHEIESAFRKLLVEAAR